MACTNCSSGGCGTSNKKTSTGVVGCRSNGASGCNKMNVFDWLENMEVAAMEKYNILEVRFRNGRKEFYRNNNYLDLVTGDSVVVEAQSGYDLGYISLQGELVRLQMLKKKVKDNDEIRNITRLATAKDLDKYEQAHERNLPTLFRTRQIAQELNLKMKLSDVEFQADNTKATFFYSADDRVDFRELIKLLAGEFKIRVEMKQISLRQEAGRLGGIGSCGRELCCSTWLTDFKSVSTSAARYQNLSLNPAKLSGQCGRLKCCLNYELETYMEALEHIPTLEKPLQTQKGPAQLYKTDIFKKLMWFGYNEETIWHPVKVERVKEIMELNLKGVNPANLLENEIEIKPLPTMKSSILDRIQEGNKKPHFKKNDSNKSNQNQKPNQNQQNKPNPNQKPNTNQTQQVKPNQNQKPNNNKSNTDQTQQVKPNQNQKPNNNKSNTDQTQQVKPNQTPKPNLKPNNNQQNKPNNNPNKNNPNNNQQNNQNKPNNNPNKNNPNNRQNFKGGKKP